MIYKKLNIIIFIGLLFMTQIFCDASKYSTASETDFEQIYMEYFKSNYNSVISFFNNFKDDLKPKDKFLLALSYKNIGEFEKSKTLLKELLKADTVLNAVVLYHLGVIFNEEKEYRLSNEYLIPILKFKSRYIELKKEANYKIIENYKNLNQLRNAEKYLNILLEKYSSNKYSYFSSGLFDMAVLSDVILDLFNINLTLKNYKNCLKYIDTIIDSYPNSNAAYSLVQILDKNQEIFKNNLTDDKIFKIHKIRIGKGEFKIAARELQILYDKNIGTDNDKFKDMKPELVYTLGWCYYKHPEKLYEKAKKYFEEVIKNYPETKFAVQSKFYIGIIFQKTGDIKNKTKCMLEIIQNYKNDYYGFAAYKELVEYYEENLEYNKILELFNEMINYFSKPSQIEYYKSSLWMNMIFYYKINDFDSALKILFKLNSIPNIKIEERTKLNFWKIKILNILKKPDEAIQYIDENNKIFDIENYYFWRTNKFAELYYNYNYSTKLKEKLHYIKYNELFDYITEYSKNDQLIYVLEKIKDYDDLLLTLNDVKIDSVNCKKIKLYCLYLKEKYSKAMAICWSLPKLDKTKYIQFLYPFPFKNFVAYFSDELIIDKNIVFAIMREESRFSPDIVSSAGAIGLMQIMPSLGFELNRKYNIRMFSEDKLFEPRINIQFGTTELKRLFNKWNDYFKDENYSVIFTAAAYNAGEDITEKWKTKILNKCSDIDVFVESIPYKETNNYVKRVYSSYNIYKIMNSISVNSMKIYYQN